MDVCETGHTGVSTKRAKAASLSMCLSSVTLSVRRLLPPIVRGSPLLQPLSPLCDRLLGAAAECGPLPMSHATNVPSVAIEVPTLFFTHVAMALAACVVVPPLLTALTLAVDC